MTMWSAFSVLCLAALCVAVDKNNFKSCEQSSFCRRLRATKPNDLPFELDLKSATVYDTSVEIKLLNTKENKEFKFVLQSILGGIFRVTIDEVNGLFPRYLPQFALNGHPEVSRLEVLDKASDSLTIKSGDNKVVINAKPVKLEFYSKDVLVAIANARGLFNFEHYRPKPAEGEVEGQDPGAWEENFKSHHDSKPRGPSGVGLDFTFPEAQRAYGLPEHGDRLALRTTGPGGVDPYRLFNLDVFEYELDSTMATYGSIPVLYAHGTKKTAGVFWHNAAETWVDIRNSKDENVVSSLVNLVSGSKSESSVDAHFMSESGKLDFFVLMGPTPSKCIQQYASLTGVSPLPQLFSLAYHQSRWNYNDQDDVKNTVSNFDIHNLPLDVMWLDIEYTDGKKYFTWDPLKFSEPEEMVKNLTSTGRKLVVIIDPHIKRESGYFLHEEALENNFYVKNKDGNVYEGWCWPGSSSYLDFFDPRVANYVKDLYKLENFKGTTHDVYIWNDMNEPSVFNGPEVTAPKDVMHHGNWEHRDIHNEYAMSQVRSTYAGLLARSPNHRPFILTRGHFAGSQRFSAMWTGDNMAKWDHLAASIYMCLSEAVAGYSFCGADVGGFFNNPDEELLLRWYQAGIWLPFFRAHAHIDTRRREPYLFPNSINRIREALRLRYAHLPLWYTLFWEHQLTGEPVIRPLFYHYPEDPTVLDLDYELLLGDSVLVRPVTEAGVSSVTLYLPGGDSTLWYDLQDYGRYQGGSYNKEVDLDSNVVFYKGGKIIPRKDRPRRSSPVMRNDPFTLYVALDNDGKSEGTLYVDDYVSFDYRDGQKYLYLSFKYENKKLTSSLIDKTDYTTQEWIEKVVILGPPEGVTGAKLTSKSKLPMVERRQGLGTVQLETSYQDNGRSLTVRKPGVSIREPFTIELV